MRFFSPFTPQFFWGHEYVISQGALPANHQGFCGDLCDMSPLMKIHLYSAIHNWSTICSIHRGAQHNVRFVCRHFVGCKSIIGSFVTTMRFSQPIKMVVRLWLQP